MKKKVTKRDYSIAKVWIVCRECGHNYPTFGNAPLCDYCGYDDFAAYRKPPEDGEPVFLPGKPGVH